MKPPSAHQLAGWGGLAVPGREIRSERLANIVDSVPLTRGLGRSYGDSSLPPPEADTVAASPLADRILGWEPTPSGDGLLHAEAGLSLREINRLFWPRGWTFPVLPGTQFVTLGGMVAADVHGKNHHVDGTVGRHVERLKLRLAAGETVDCSREQQPDLFRATLGGMGLTGHILEVWIRMKAIPSGWVDCESRRIGGLDDFLAALRTSADEWPYTVGWFDALAHGSNLGRGILLSGRWAPESKAPPQPPKPLRRIAVPFSLPSWVLNRLTVRTFNELYFRRHPRRTRRSIVHPEKFFHPLDAILHWNRIYGRRGFTQHQCVLPEAERPGAVRRFLEELARLGGASFLCVIKDCGEEGEGILSFPRPGITIAVDLPIRKNTQALIDSLNERVIAEGGRIYLAKDAFTRRDHFAAMEPRLRTFQTIRKDHDPAGLLASAQSRRLLGVES